MENNLLSLKTMMRKQGIIFCFSGLIYQEMLSNVVESVKKELSISGAENSIINSIFFIAIEQMQNIMKYSVDKIFLDGEKQASNGICVIGFDDNKKKYYVSSSNKIKLNDRQIIQEKIDKINSLEPKEKRKYARELLRSGKDSHNDGAGIGFVEMGKTSSEDIEYTFTNQDENELFEIKVYI